MTWRIRVPTVLYGNSAEAAPEPRILVDELGDPEHAQWLTIAETEATIAWIRASQGWLEGASTRKVADALAAALDALATHPPRVIIDKMMGIVQGESGGGEPTWVRVSVESAVQEVSNPRITLEVADSIQGLGTRDTWWLLNTEAKQLAAMLRRGEGTLQEVGPNQRPWLHVISVAARGDRPAAVCLRFEDDSIGGASVLQFNLLDAERLAVLLDEAAGFERAHPAHVFAPPEPREREIARVELLSSAASG